MPAHKRELSRRLCQCGKAAKYEVRNSQNAPYGEYCNRCAETLIRNLNREEESRD